MESFKRDWDNYISPFIAGLGFGAIPFLAYGLYLMIAYTDRIQVGEEVRVFLATVYQTEQSYGVAFDNIVVFLTPLATGCIGVLIAQIFKARSK